MKAEELRLLKEIRNGDDKALDTLIRHWYPRVYAYVLKILSCEEDAQDITQEVFLALLRNIQNILPLTRFEGWLIRTAYNKCMDHFRLQKRHTDTPTAETAQSTDYALAAALKQALQALPPKQRQAFILYHFHRFTTREISEMTHAPLPTVKSRLASAKRSLQNMLKEKN